MCRTKNTYIDYTVNNNFKLPFENKREPLYKITAKIYT